MGLFDNLFFGSPLKAEFKKLTEENQRVVAFTIAIADLSKRHVESDLIPLVETAIGRKLTNTEREAVTNELAVAMIASARFPDKFTSVRDVGCAPELLREMIVMVMLSESNDKRGVLEKTNYSRNCDETRIQVSLSIRRIIGDKNNDWLSRLSEGEFATEWKSFILEFISGMITGMKRGGHSVLTKRIMGRMDTLNPVSTNILREYIRRVS